MTINVYVVLLFTLVSGIGVGALAVGGIGIRYILQLQEKLSAVNLELGKALGELKDIKNHEVASLTGRQQILWGLLGSVERHLFLERRDGKLIRVIGETSDLRIFPEMTPELAEEIASFLIAKAVKVAGKVVAGCVGAAVLN